MEQETMHDASAPGAKPEPSEDARATEQRGEEQGGAVKRGAEKGGSRRLFSLTSQLRRQKSPSEPAEQPAAQSAPRPASLPSSAMRPVPRPANGLPSGTANEAAESADGDGYQPESRPVPRNGNGNGFGTMDASIHEDRAEEHPAATADGFEELAAPREVVKPAARPAPAAPRRPSRPIYTLQQVHEMTGIPYPKLAYYAASEAARIPSLGERHAPAYPFESLQAFCALHAERTSGWEIPDLTPPEDEISLRLEALERGQQQLEAVLQAALAELAEPLTGSSF